MQNDQKLSDRLQRAIEADYPFKKEREAAYIDVEKLHIEYVKAYALEHGGTVTNIDMYDHFSTSELQDCARNVAESMRMYCENYLNGITDLTELRDENGNRFDEPQFREIP
jgi:hypothetical protein